MLVMDDWLLDPHITYLNHGAFGACPKPVLEAQQAFRQELEREPAYFFEHRWEPLLDEARAALADFVGAAPADLVFVPNATTGVNAVLRSLTFEPGDELLTTNHAYNACRNALNFVADRWGLQIVVAEVPFPIKTAEQMVEAVLACCSTRTRLALLDHITSQTALVFPIEALVKALRQRGVETLVDGAHAPGMIPLNLEAIGATYYVGNCHKWLCAPKGAGFLYIQPDRQSTIRPLTISHGANSPRCDRSRWQLEFDWMGTDDPTPYFCVPTVIEWLRSRFPGGWPALMAHNHQLVVAARSHLCQKLAVEPPCPDDLLGAIAVLPLPDGPAEALHQDLLKHHRLEVPIFPWPQPPARWLRISAQLYNGLADYERLGEALTALLQNETLTRDD